MSLTSTASLYTKLGRGLCVIDTVDPDKGKRPKFKDWPNNPRTFGQVKGYIDRGHNIGFVIGPTDLVIDVDPRNGGLEGLAVMLDDIGHESVESLFEHYPTVITGSGGYHFYMAAPEGIKVHHTIERYGKGVEFKTKGQQVIIPGSIHPATKKPYTWAPETPFREPSPPAPTHLIDLIERVPVAIDLSKRSSAGQFTPEDLAAMLQWIPPNEVNSDQEWFSMLCACHHATAGAGLAEFAEWSRQYDEGEAKSLYEIKSRWDSLSIDKDDPVTVGTLIARVRNHGGTIPGEIEAADAIDDFEGHFDDDGVILSADEVLRLKQERRKLIKEQSHKKRNSAKGEASIADDWADVIDDGKPADDWADVIDGEAPGISQPPKEQKRLIDSGVVTLAQEVALLTPGASAADITKTLKKVAKVDHIHRAVLLRDFAKNTGITRGDLKSAIQSLVRPKAVTDDDIDDIALVLSTRVRNRHFKGGKHLLRTRGLWYRYTGRYWEPVEGDLVDQTILKTCIEYSAENPEDQTPLTSMLQATERILRARQAVEADPFKLNELPRPIINTLSGELHLSPSGKGRLRPHTPGSFLLNCLDRVEYKPGAECPLMDRTLREIFAKDKHRDETIRHFWELVGYVIQPQKDIPTWWLFHGSGANGKTALTKIIIELMGSACVQMPIQDFNSSKGPHALSVLPGKLALIDDDVKKNAVLPDDFMKKISENKTLYANPKRESYFPFISSLSPILCSNHHPKITDLSEGMVRRAMVIPFTRHFPADKCDKSRAATIIKTELSGVLNRALDGLVRLRARGSFLPSKTCLDAKRAWLYGSNSTAAFFQDCVTRAKGTKVLIDDIYNAYFEWADDQELEARYRLTKRALVEALISSGFKRCKSNDGSGRCLANIALKRVSDFDDK